MQNATLNQAWEHSTNTLNPVDLTSCYPQKDMATRILSDVMSFRRIPKTSHSCDNETCSTCSALYLPAITAHIEKNEPVIFILPAFPGKSPNPQKVLGTLPDFAEELSLNFLESLCQKVKSYYSPGMKVVLCSDGRVFSDVVGITETHITAYQVELDKLIQKTSSSNISTFNLDDVYENLNFIQMRETLMKQYGESLDTLKNKIRHGSTDSAKPDEHEANNMYRGITRFLFEDAIHPGQNQSRTAIQKDSRNRAYEVIRRSNAWSNLIAKRFPKATRLSIHPQICGSKKLGIRLIGNEHWMTPWHGVAVETSKGYVLLKRSEAEKLGAQLVYSPNKRPSHYTTLTP